jgi:VMA21-like domain
MGKKNKNQLETKTEDKAYNPADDDALVPYHTKQASMAVIYLLFFSILMFTLPFVAFYGVRDTLHKYLHIDGFQNTCWSVIAAVVTVNIVIALYAFCGFLDARREEDTVNKFAQSKAKTN